MARVWFWDQMHGRLSAIWVCSTNAGVLHLHEGVLADLYQYCHEMCCNCVSVNLRCSNFCAISAWYLNYQDVKHHSEESIDLTEDILDRALGGRGGWVVSGGFWGWGGTWGGIGLTGRGLRESMLYLRRRTKKFCCSKFFRVVAVF